LGSGPDLAVVARPVPPLCRRRMLHSPDRRMAAGI